jgi:hypothetical protein
VRAGDGAEVDFNAIAPDNQRQPIRPNLGCHYRQNRSFPSGVTGRGDSPGRRNSRSTVDACGQTAHSRKSGGGNTCFGCGTEDSAD